MVEQSPYKRPTIGSIPTGSKQSAYSSVDIEHQATNLGVGSSNLPRRAK